MPSVIIKSADQSKTTDTAIADDSELVLALTAQKFYEIEAVVKWGNSNAGTDPDFKWAWKFTGTLVFANGVIMGNNRPVPLSWRDADNIGQHQNMTAGVLTAGDVINTLTSISGTASVVALHLYLKVSDTGGNFSFQWAQRVSSATATTVYGGSTLYVAERIVPT